MRSRPRSPSGLLVALLAIVAVLLAACTSSTTPAPSGAAGPAGSVVYALEADPTTLDPQATLDNAERTVSDNVYESLVFRNGQTSALEPGLATSWEIQSDQTTWRFKLRPNVKFTNGAAMNADAVVASVERVLDPNFKSGQVSYLTGLKGAKKVDDLTVDITTDGPDPILPIQLNWLKIVDPAYAKTADISSKPVGTGPYKFVEWKKGQNISLTANTDYWGTKPAIKDVTLRVIPEINTRLQALKTGELDLTASLSPELISQAPATATQKSIENYLVYFKTGSGAFADKNTRLAAQYAVDKEGILKSLLDGHGTVEPGQFLRSDWSGFNPNLKPYPYDVNKAKQLLAGKTPEIQLVGESGRWLKDKEVVQSVGAYLTAAGFKVNLEIKEFGAWVSTYFLPPEQKVPALFASLSGELLDVDRPLTAMACPSKPSDWCDQTYTDLVNKARGTIDDKARQDLYNQATQRIYDESPVLFLVSPDNIYGMSAKLSWKPRLDGSIQFAEMSLK